MTSAERFREMLARSGRPMALYRTEAQYHAEMHILWRLLDVVDEVLDEPAAALVTDAI
jgi:hypothetical protein